MYKRQLRGTDRSVADICLSAGLRSVGSFTTSVTRTYGMSPTADDRLVRDDDVVERVSDLARDARLVERHANTGATCVGPPQRTPGGRARQGNRAARGPGGWDTVGRSRLVLDQPKGGGLRPTGREMRGNA